MEVGSVCGILLIVILGVFLCVIVWIGGYIIIGVG